MSLSDADRESLERLREGADLLLLRALQVCTHVECTGRVKLPDGRLGPEYRLCGAHVAANEMFCERHRR